MTYHVGHALLNVAIESGLGYALASLAYASNPGLSVGLAASIAIVKEITTPVFQAIENRSNSTIFDRSFADQKMVLRTIKLAFDSVLGAVLFTGVVVGICGLKSPAAIPIISFIAFIVLIDFGHRLLLSGGNTLFGPRFQPTY
jgi:hypothetical protein